ncbi:MAG: hypothetical protein ACE5QV_02505, partial [Fidelibacterota bacterium]
AGIKILTVDGRVIREFLYEKGEIKINQVFWDGRDSRGNFVASGIYLISIFSPRGHTAVEKLAVIRR